MPIEKPRMVDRMMPKKAISRVFCRPTRAASRCVLREVYSMNGENEMS